MFGDITQNQPATQANYKEEHFVYPYQVTLTANQALTDQSLLIDGDSDFIALAVHGTKTGAYSIRIKNGNGRYVSSVQLKDVNCVGSAQFPVPFTKPLLLDRRGRIGIDITDLSGAPNTIELCFVGLKRFPV